jgi:predicted P-loop ATPase
VKEAGNYLLGTLRQTTIRHDGEPCTNLHRRKDAVVSRSAITLDVDHPEPTFTDKLELVFPYQTLVHTTFSSSPDEPRYRLIVAVDRELAPDEYVVAAQALMQLLGPEQFDPSTVQPERYMFRPAAQHREWYQHWVLPGTPVPVTDLLENFEPDLSTKPIPKPARKKRDPFDIEGVVGAFNRAYEDLSLLVDEYELPYEESGADRWHLVGARSVAGMGPVDRGLWYSHHVSDPAYGVTCTAFDLVRLHHFGELDEDTPRQTPIHKLPSYEAMLDLATVDARVTAELVGPDFAAEMAEDVEDNEWRAQIRRSNRTGHMQDTITNWDLIARNHELFQGLYFNEFTLAVETDQDFPWRKVENGGPILTKRDINALSLQLEREFGLRPTRLMVESIIDVCSMRRFVNPVRDYLDNLVWDGQPRVETCLPGVRDSEFARMVARKVMTAAVARIYEPGCKWDHTLVLFGNEGIGKSEWINRIARGHSATLGRVGDKDTLLIMQRSWIMVSDEGHSLRKADADTIKEFLTRSEDVFRMPYDRESVAHKRHCVIWSTTNDSVFLRNQQGNRRFLIVNCEDRVDFDEITSDYVDQLWAEAVYMYRAGEQLYLNDEESELAGWYRESFVEEDSISGIIEEYLDNLVPENWGTMSPTQRRQWVEDRAEGLVPEGTEQITEVCSTQIWVEALGRPIGDRRRPDLLEITTALKKLPGWKKLPGRTRISGYGAQAVFRRIDKEEEDLL